MELAKLEGSEKQIAWAEKIRAAVVDQWESKCRRQDADAVGSDDLLPSKMAAVLIRDVRPLEQAWLVANVFGQTSAKWWIDNRGENWIAKASGATKDARRAAVKAAKESGELGIHDSF